LAPPNPRVLYSSLIGSVLVFLVSARLFTVSFPYAPVGFLSPPPRPILQEYSVFGSVVENASVPAFFLFFCPCGLFLCVVHGPDILSFSDTLPWALLVFWFRSPPLYLLESHPTCRRLTCSACPHSTVLNCFSSVLSRSSVAFFPCCPV